MSTNTPVAIITGAAGNLGCATAQAFQDSGYRTVLVDRSHDRLPAVYASLVTSSDHLLSGGVDLCDPAALQTLVDDVLGRFGRIDVLVNTVGGWRGGKPVHEDDLATWDFLLGVNLRSTLLACRSVVPQLIRQRRGWIINVASRNALAGTAGYAAYSAAKSAVIRLTESLADELKNLNINVNCILPGTIDTPQNRAAIPQAEFSRWVAPAAIAEVILFLASDAARAIHGAAVPVYGTG